MSQMCGKRADRPKGFVCLRNKHDDDQHYMAKPPRMKVRWDHEAMLWSVVCPYHGNARPTFHDHSEALRYVRLHLERTHADQMQSAWRSDV